jgi:flavin-dependent dehydrogenase
MSQTYVMARAGAYDVIVVGGRIAGSLTAMQLARRGASVLVLESRRFPSDTLSTHFFRGDGLVRGLPDVGALDEVLASGRPPRLTREYFYSGRGDSVEPGPPQEPGTAGFCLSVRRRTLDAILAARAEALPGVTFLTDCKAIDLVRSGHDVVGVVDAGANQHLAAVVVGADGRRSMVARRVGAQDRERRAPARVMYYRYVTGWVSPDSGAPDAPEFSLLENELAYVFPSDGDVACVALSIPLEQYAVASADAPAYFVLRLRQHTLLWPRLRAAQPLGRMFVGPPHDSVVRQAAGRGWALVGDAGTHQDPWSGFGMDTAARQAEALADCLSAESPDWATDYADACDAVTAERFSMTVTHMPDLRTLMT